MHVSKGSQVFVAPHQPLYSQAADALVAFIAENQYEPGAVLPGEDELARQLRVSRSTLREAMGMLEKDGLVVRRHGVGTFVTNPEAARFTFGLHQLIPLRILAGQAGSQLEMLERDVSRVAPAPDLQVLFGLTGGDLLLRVQTVLRIDGWCTGYYDYRIPPLVVDAEEFEASGLSVLEYCLAQERPTIRYADSELHAVNADEELAARMQLPAGAAVLNMVETIYDATDKPVMRAYTYHATQQLRFHIVRHVPSLPSRYRTRLYAVEQPLRPTTGRVATEAGRLRQAGVRYESCKSKRLGLSVEEAGGSVPGTSSPLNAARRSCMAPTLAGE